MKKLTILVVMILGVISLSSAQTVTTYVFESSLQEELHYNKVKDSFESSGKYYEGQFTVQVSPYKLTLLQNGQTIFSETLVPAKQEDMEKWKIFGFFNPNNRYMTISVLLNKEETIKATGEHGIIWICERGSSGPTGVSLVLTKLIGTNTYNVTTVQGLE